MARARSPEYPSISLKEAIDRVKMVYDNDYQNRVPREVIATHMGYKGLSGASLPVLAALGKYGLLEGRGNETRVSDLAVKILAHATGSAERIEALAEAASNPELFEELDERFPRGKGSDQAIRSYLLTNKFIPSAADAAIRAYRDTMALVEAESVGYASAELEPEKPPVTPHVNTPPPAKLGQQHAVFPLPEGEVSLSFPATLSAASAKTMAAFVSLALEQAEQQAKAREAAPDDPLRRMTEELGRPDNSLKDKLNP